MASCHWQRGDTVGPPSSMAALCGGCCSSTTALYQCCVGGVVQMTRCPVPVVFNDQFWWGWNVYGHTAEAWRLKPLHRQLCCVAGLNNGRFSSLKLWMTLQEWNRDVTKIYDKEQLMQPFSHVNAVIHVNMHVCNVHIAYISCNCSASPSYFFMSFWKLNYVTRALSWHWIILL